MEGGGGGGGAEDVGGGDELGVVVEGGGDCACNVHTSLYAAEPGGGLEPTHELFFWTSRPAETLQLVSLGA